MKNPDSDLTAPETILVSLLGATDAIWFPSRESHHSGRINPSVTNAYETRKAYRESGVSWASGGRSDAERKESQRALEELVRDGLVTVEKPHGAKTLFARLTAAAYDRTRRQCGLQGFAMGYLMLRLVAHFSTRPATLMQHVLVPETALNGGKGWDGVGDGGNLYRAAQRALPALVSGSITTNCDGERRVYFSVSDAGWRLLDDGSKPDFAVDRIPPDVRFSTAYHDFLAAERKKLFARTPIDETELGWLPLSVAHHDLPLRGRPQ